MHFFSAVLSYNLQIEQKPMEKPAYFSTKLYKGLQTIPHSAPPPRRVIPENSLFARSLISSPQGQQLPPPGIFACLMQFARKVSQMASLLRPILPADEVLEFLLFVTLIAFLLQMISSHLTSSLGQLPRFSLLQVPTQFGNHHDDKVNGNASQWPLGMVLQEGLIQYRCHLFGVRDDSHLAEFSLTLRKCL